MKFTLKHAMVAAALIASSAPALADPNDATVPLVIPDTTPLPSTNDGGLQLMILNTGDATWSLSAYLGLTLTQVLPASMDGSDGLGLTLTWNIAGLTSAIASSGIALADLRWGVSAGDKGTLTATANPGAIRLATTVAGPVNTVPNNGLVSAVNHVDNVTTGANQTPGSLDVNIAAFNPNDIKNELSTNYGSANGFTWATDLNSALSMYLLSNSAGLTGQNLDATSVAYAGTWSLNVAAGTLSYIVAPSAVPVPAAVWLLLSGLGGFGVLGRRRKAA